VYIGAVCNLTVERDGMVTNERQFCIGFQLTFRCTLAESAYDWIVSPFMNGVLGNVAATGGGQTVTVGRFLLNGSGVDVGRMSTLQVTLFEGLVGNTTVSVR